MGKKTFKENIQSYGIKMLLSYVEKNPGENVQKIIDVLSKLDKTEAIETQINAVKNVMADKDSNWFKFVENLYADTDLEVRRKLVENYIINTGIVGLQREREAEEKYGCNIPWAILLDPTSACNLHCIGCWAAEYGNRLNLTYEEMDSIVTQGKELGTYMYIFSGGEPTIRKDDIFKLCEKHDDCAFLAFTNGTLIDEAFADEMLRVKNFVPAISVEGFGEATDFRRGKGTYDKVIRAMDILKKKNLPFGISCCYTRQNAEVIGSEEYIDDMIAKGAKFAWFFTYMPVGGDAVPELMVTAEQREYMYHQIRKFRSTKPIFTMDFWNDGEYVGGCIAGGRCYLHINANGDIEPCAFIHYSDSNIREKTLVEAYQSPLFMSYRQNQPFSENLLRPCPLLDNPGRLADMVDDSGAHSTDLECPEDAHKLCGKCTDTAWKWKDTADRLWVDSGHELSEEEKDNDCAS